VVTDDYNNLFLSDTLSVEVYSTDYTLLIHQPSCPDDHNGSITIQDQGSDPIALTYLNNLSSPSGVWTSLSAGSYEVTIASLHGCSWSSSVSLMDPPMLELTWSSDTLTCFGDQSGLIQWTAEPIELLSQGMIVDGLNGSLPAGEYTLEVADTNGCIQQVTAEVFQPEEIQGQSNVMDVLCAGDSSGMIEAEPSGGTGMLTMDIQGVDGNAWILPAGIYLLTITDEVGCTSTEWIEIAQPEPLNYSIESQPDVNQQGTGSIAIFAQGGTPPYQVFWNNELYSEGQIDSLPSGIYTGQLFDVNGCSATWYAVVEEELGVMESQSSVRLWPNPAEERVQIISEQVGHWRCLDMVGKTVMEGFTGVNSWELNVAALQQGYYILELSGDTRMAFLVQR
jgi:hypothetical protein